MLNPRKDCTGKIENKLWLVLFVNMYHTMLTRVTVMVAYILITNIILYNVSSLAAIDTHAWAFSMVQ